MKKVQFAYYKAPNMGDLLNELLMERVFNVEFVNTHNIPNIELTGIGSFMDDLFEGPNTHSTGIKYRVKKLVYNHSFSTCYTWGTGFISDFSMQLTGLCRNKVKFMAVRGKKTQKCIEKILNIKIDPVLGDGGILAPMLLDSPVKKKYEMGIIPHFKEKKCFAVQVIKEKYPNALIIDLQEDPMKVVRDIASCDYIISSSLHGLILADAFRIPNIRVYLTDAPMGDGFKFDDYYSAYGLEVSPIEIKNISDVPAIDTIVGNYKVTDMMVKKMQDDMFGCMNEFLKGR